MKTEIEVNENAEEFLKCPISWDYTNGENLPNMPTGKKYVIGYNDTYGLLNVHEDDGVSFYEGRKDIRETLKKLEDEPRKEIDEVIGKIILTAYKDEKLEVLVDKR